MTEEEKAFEAGRSRALEIMAKWKELRRIEEAAREMAIRHSRPFCSEGTRTGRFRADKPNVSNVPRKGEKVNINDTVTKTEPEIVEIDCGDAKSGCPMCGPDRKKKVHGKRAEVVRKAGGTAKVKIMEGDLAGKDAHCPEERLKPRHAEKYVEPEPEPEPEKPKIVVKDFGYGPACSSCHATRGEDHCKGCKYEGQAI